MLFWGIGWTALKILTLSLPVDVIVFWRFFLMSLAFLPILYFYKLPFNFTQSSLKYIISSSVLNILFMIFSFFGVKYGLAGSGSVIITTLSPLMTFLLLILFFKNKVSPFQYLGIFIGIVGGILILQLHDLSLFLNGSNIYFVLSALVWAGVTLLAQYSQKHIHPLHYSFFISVIATLASFIYAYDSDLTIVFEQDIEFWIALVYLGVFAQAIATTIFFIASGKIGSAKTSSFMFLVPLFALASAYIILGEPIELHIIIGGILSIFAVYLINKNKAI